MRNETTQLKSRIFNLHLVIFYKLKLAELLVIEIIILSIVVYSASLDRPIFVLLLLVTAAAYLIYQVLLFVLPLFRHLKAVKLEPSLRFSFLNKKIEIEKIGDSKNNLILESKEILLALETKTTFYLILAGKTGFVLNKDGFLASTPESFKNYLFTNKIPVR